MTRIEKDFYFLAGVHFDGQFHINSYDVILSMLIETECVREHSIALERVEHFIKDVLTNTVFVEAEDRLSIDNYLNAGMKVCELPDQPFDQVVAIVLLLKLNAIMEDRVKITDLTLGSSLSEGIRYPIVTETAENAAIVMGNHWWHKPDTSTRNGDISFLDTDNIVRLFNEDEWMSLGLSWKERAKK